MLGTCRLLARAPHTFAKSGTGISSCSTSYAPSSTSGRPVNCHHESHRGWTPPPPPQASAVHTSINTLRAAALQGRANVSCRATSQASQAAALQDRRLAVEAAAEDDAEASESGADDADELSPAEESLQILEWPAVCRQVACFCGTVMASERLLAGRLPSGADQRDSERLLQETAEAMEAGLSVTGVFDIRPAITAAADGACLNAKQLEGVGRSMAAARAARTAATVRSDASGVGRDTLKYPALAALAGVEVEAEAQLLAVIQQCIKLSSVSDEASTKLRDVRTARAANRIALDALMDKWARDMVAIGASDDRNVSVIRNRACLGIKAGRQSSLPRGSVRLGASSTGATLYMEVAPAVALNNREAELAEREQHEETEVLLLLSSLVGEHVEALRRLLEQATALDIAAARAKHAAWLQAVRPSFIAGAEAVSPIHLPDARHPLLMQPALMPLPSPPSPEENRFDRNFGEAPSWERRLKPPGKATAEAHQPSAELPKALELCVPADKKIVAITGPNTGGKTATLKTVGLLVVMAQAGLFVPCHTQPKGGEAGPASSEASTSLPAAAAAVTMKPSASSGIRLRWFDQVLADIGDAQSLQQNLSTFSGHVRRIQRVLTSATSNSLVLLDEVGSGTDPMEGAALARAILDRLAGQAALTFATTHHAELKQACDEDDRYAKVSMEFSVATLRPTFRLCWGAAGASNALAIAQALGFDSSIVKDAAAIAAAAAAARGNEAGRMAAVAESLAKQLKDTEQQLEALVAARTRREEVMMKVHHVMHDMLVLRTQYKASQEPIVQERNRLQRSLQHALDGYKAGTCTLDQVEEAFKEIEGYIPTVVARSRNQTLVEEGDPKPNDRVFVRRMGTRFGYGTVVSVKGDTVTVSLDTSWLVGMIGRGSERPKKHRFLKSEIQVLKEGRETPLDAWDMSASLAQINGTMDLESTGLNKLLPQGEQAMMQRAWDMVFNEQDMREELESMQEVS